PMSLAAVPVDALRRASYPGCRVATASATPGSAGVARTAAVSARRRVEKGIPFQTVAGRATRRSMRLCAALGVAGALADVLAQPRRRQRLEAAVARRVTRVHEFEEGVRMNRIRNGAAIALMAGA